MIDQIEMALATDGDDYLARMSAFIDSVLADLARALFPVDPLYGFAESRAMSMRTSAQKRQGRVIECALREALRLSPHHDVWSESKFRISREADEKIATTRDAWRFSPCVYGEQKRIVQIDAVVFDRRVRSLSAYEVKRGNGRLDAGKQRQTLHDMRAVHALLRSYGHRFDPAAVDSRIICYFGADMACFRDVALNRTQLDEHFGFAVFDRIEQVNEIYRLRLDSLIATPPGVLP